MERLVEREERGRVVRLRREFQFSDPLADRLTALAASAHGEPQALADALLAVREVFPVDLAGHVEFRAELHRALQLLREHGARGAIAALK
jgi:fructuronate reductase